MTKPKIVPVVDDKNLVRDTQSKALLANNKTLLEEHRQKKAFLAKMLKQSEEIDSLKKDIGEIKDLLSKLVQSR